MSEHGNIQRVNAQLWTLKEEDLHRYTPEQLEAMLLPHDPNRPGAPDPQVGAPNLEERLEAQREMVRKELARRKL